MSLVRLGADAGVDEILSNIDEHGYCILGKLVSDELIDLLKKEMAPHVEAAEFGTDERGGAKTRRIGSLLGRSRSSHELIGHPKVLEVANRYLRRSSTVVQLNVTMMNCIAPGEKAQTLHRDEAVWELFPFPIDYPIELSTVWALDDFTEENGATRLVPGSHKSERPWGSFTMEETVAAEMPRGSVIVYSGKLMHGGGANRSQATRTGLLIDYCVGWLRQEENQYLSVPIEVARTFPRHIQRLMGYDMGSTNVALGYVQSWEHPMVALHPELSPLPTDKVPEEFWTE